MTDKYVYISGMDELHGPMPESEAWAMANDQNRLNLELNANRSHANSVYTIAIVLDKPDYKPDLWSFTDEHPAANPIGDPMSNKLPEPLKPIRQQWMTGVIHTSEALRLAHEAGRLEAKTVKITVADVLVDHELPDVQAQIRDAIMGSGLVQRTLAAEREAGRLEVLEQLKSCICEWDIVGGWVVTSEREIRNFSENKDVLAYLDTQAIPSSGDAEPAQ